MDSIEPERFIAASPLFRNMPSDEIARITAQFQMETYPKGSRIIERGMWHGFFHIITSGSVSVLLQEEDRHSEEIILTHLARGECFGEMSLITGEVPSATIRAEQDTLLWSLSHSDFMLFAANSPTLLRNINHILSTRLAQTNQQVATRQHGECLSLTMVPSTNADASLQYSLVVYIAQALAERSHKRVCLIELCDAEQAVGPHFATQADQLRPSLLACSESPDLIHKHSAATINATGQRFPALTTLTDEYTSKQAEADQASPGHISSTLHTLATLYDYLLLVTTPETPAYITSMVEGMCQRSLMLVSADTESIRDAQNILASSQSPIPCSVFVAHVPEQPTIGAQDRYTAQLGLNTEYTSGETTRLVRLLPADTSLLEHCWEEQVTPDKLMSGVPGKALTKAIDFVARHIAHQTIGIAFGGGGARGFAHIGVLQRLQESDIPLDYISACSIGCIPVCLYLLGKAPKEIEEHFLHIQRYVGQWHLSRSSLFSNKSLKRRFIEQAEGKCFEDLFTPFAMIAVDLATHSGVILDRGPLWQAGLASVALPGIFPPVRIGKHILVDAGMHDPVPVNILRHMGADITIASELSTEDLYIYQRINPVAQEEGNNSRAQQKPTPHIVDLLLRSYDMAMATIGMHSVRNADIAIRPKLHNISLRQFSEGQKFVAAGYDATDKALPALRKRLPWLAE